MRKVISVQSLCAIIALLVSYILFTNNAKFWLFTSMIFLTFPVFYGLRRFTEGKGLPRITVGYFVNSVSNLVIESCICSNFVFLLLMPK